jgi:hypothetical protein
VSVYLSAGEKACQDLRGGTGGQSGAAYGLPPGSCAEAAALLGGNAGKGIAAAIALHLWLVDPWS